MQEKVQTESYKSTIGHELRTPLNSSSFILKSIINTIGSSLSLTQASILEVKTRVALVLAQLQFMECFIEDLLSMNLLRNGLRVMNKECFDVNETIDFIVSIFQIKAEMKGISVTHAV